MDEILVTANTSGLPAILGSHSSPEFVVVWLSDGSQDIKGARFLASGAKIGDDFQVKTNDGSRASSPVIAQIHDFLSPGFVVAWTAANNVFLQRFTSEGVKSGGVIQANTMSVAADAPTIAGLLRSQNSPGGNFVVSWGGGIQGIRAQIFTKTGTRVGTEIVVSSSDGVHSSPVITELNGGGFVIAWQGNPGTPRESNRLQMFNPDGTKSGGEQRPNHGVGLGQSTMTFIDAGGNGSTPQPGDFVNVQLSSAGTSGDDEVQIVVAQLFDPGGALNARINVTHRDDQTISSRPAVRALRFGNLVATWSEKGLPTTGKFDHNIKAKLLSVQAAGTQDFLTASEAVVKIDTGRSDMPRNRHSPCAAVMGEEGEFIAFAWTDLGPVEATSAGTVKARILSRDLV
jgi:hypothetical protein